MVKRSLTNLKERKSCSSFSDHNGIILDLTNRKTKEKSSDMWKVTGTILINPEEDLKKIKNILNGMKKKMNISNVMRCS